MMSSGRVLKRKKGLSAGQSAATVSDWALFVLICDRMLCFLSLRNWIANYSLFNSELVCRGLGGGRLGLIEGMGGGWTC